jgi:hypothetical protein
MANPKSSAKAPDPQAAKVDVPQATSAPEPSNVAADIIQELKVTGHLMALPAGLFCIINQPHANVGPTGLPGVRISPPPAGGQFVEISAFRPDGWLSANGDAALVRVHKGPAQLLVTIYQQPSQPDAAPKLQVRQLLGVDDMPAPAPGPAAAPREKIDIMAHIQTRGDVGVKFGHWLGEQGSQNWIEGFAIAAPEGTNVADLAYQAVLGRGWLSPWVEAGQYCGSRGMALPLLGLRVRLTGDAAEQFDLTVAASFIDGTKAGPVGQDETCESVSLAPLEAMLITLTPKAKKAAKGKK